MVQSYLEVAIATELLMAERLDRSATSVVLLRRKEGKRVFLSKQNDNVTFK